MKRADKKGTPLRFPHHGKNMPIIRNHIPKELVMQIKISCSLKTFKDPNNHKQGADVLVLEREALSRCENGEK